MDPVPVTVVCWGPVLTPYYGLNRFLAMLIAEYIKRKFERETFLFDTLITEIEAASSPAHTCLSWNHVMGRNAASGSYAILSGAQHAVLIDPFCFGKDHLITFERAGSAWKDTFNVVIVRHGRGALPTPPGSAVTRELPPRPRHLWPYHIPY